MKAPPRSHVRFKIEPRMVSADKIARRLGITLPAFEGKLRSLIAAGFPPAEPITGNYVLDAVDRWIDRVGKIDEAATLAEAEAEIMAMAQARPWRKK